MSHFLEIFPSTSRRKARKRQTEREREKEYHQTELMLLFLIEQNERRNTFLEQQIVSATSPAHAFWPFTAFSHIILQLCSHVFLSRRRTSIGQTCWEHYRHEFFVGIYLLVSRAFGSALIWFSSKANHWPCHSKCTQLWRLFIFHQRRE